MKIKTAELEGAALDWAVAKCEGVTIMPNKRDGSYITYKNGDVVFLRYSTNWAQGGPIIEREGIDIYTSGEWVAEIVRDTPVVQAHGATPLIAAMRCLVASRLADEVEVPDELQA